MTWSGSARSSRPARWPRFGSLGPRGAACVRGAPNWSRWSPPRTWRDGFGNALSCPPPAARTLRSTQMETNGKRLRLLYSDVNGIERGKYLLGDWVGGVAAFCIGVYPLTHDREILPIPGIQFDVGLHDIDAHLDATTLRPSWEPDTVLGIADLEYHGRP